MLPASTDMPLSDMAGLYELRELLRSEEMLGSAEMLLITSATELRLAGMDNGGR